MRVRFKGLCQRVRSNNGIVEVLFTRQVVAKQQEEHALINVLKGDREFEKGKHYWVTVEPAFPHSLRKKGSRS